MKKLFIVFGSILFVSALTFTSCKKDKKDDGGGGGGGNVSVISANGDIIGDDTGDVDKVAALTWSDYSDGYEAGVANFKNNSFKINLSATVPDEYLSFFDEDDYDGDVKVNPKDAKGCSLEILAYDSDGDEIGEFWQEDERSNSAYYAEYVYVNKNFTIKGTEHDYYGGTYTYDCSLKKGWNIIYSYYKWNNDSEEGKLTTQKPSNMNLKWYYFGDYWKSNGGHAKKTPFANKLKYKEVID